MQSKLLNSDIRIIVRNMANQLINKFDAPGKIGATAQWCFKLITKYPNLADDGQDLYKKTVKKFDFKVM